jgi:hypothetical protein
MKKLRIFLLVLGGLIITYFGAKVVRTISVVDQLKQLKTDHFTISYQGIYDDDAQNIGDYLEENYDRIRTNLYDPDHELVRVFIHPTQTEFNKATELPNSSAKGTSRGPNEFHLIWTNWFNSIFPDDPLKTAVHEFTHCIQLNILIKDAQKQWTDADQGDFDAVFEQKFIKEYPQWFWEALCDYEAGVVNPISVRYGMSKNLTLQELNNSNQIYSVGYTIIEYIVEKWGSDKLPSLITSYVDIPSVLGISETEFEKGWVEFVDEKY